MERADIRMSQCKKKKKNTVVSTEINNRGGKF